MQFKQWNGFNTGAWEHNINVRDFVQKNYDAYYGDDSFLMPATERTKNLMEKVNALFKEEKEKGGVYAFV